MRKPKLLKVLTLILATLLFSAALVYLLFGRGGEAAQIKWGVSFDPYYAQYLGLDWKKTYLSLLDEVGVDHFRLVALWDAIEPEDDQLDFAWLDFQVQEAKKRGVKLILAIGRRLPRWPECHVPSWAKGLSEGQQQAKVLELLPQIINRYRDFSNLEFWQVENEPYVQFFGEECPGPDEQFVRREMELVESLDPIHPILLTESGELSFWFKISRLGNYVGVSMYEVIYDDGKTFIPIPGYRRYPLPQHYYRIKANFYKRLGWVKEIFVSELQAEPWGPKPIPQTSPEEQDYSFSPEIFRYNLRFARSTGFSRFYLWGAEWWIYAKEKLGVSDFFEEAKKLWGR